MLPFSREEFLAVFVSYNESIWPVHAVAYLAGILAVVLLCRPGPASERIVSTILAVFWIWTGIVYHCLFFSKINKAAYLFGALFLAQGQAGAREEIQTPAPKIRSRDRRA